MQILVVIIKDEMNEIAFKNWKIAIVDQDSTRFYHMNQFDQMLPLVANGLRQLVNDINHIDHNHVLAFTKMECVVLIKADKIINLSFKIQSRLLFTIKSFNDCSLSVVKNLLLLTTIIKHLQQLKLPKWNWQWQIIGSDNHPYLNDYYDLSYQWQWKWKNLVITNLQIVGAIGFVNRKDFDWKTQMANLNYTNIKWKTIASKINQSYKNPLTINVSGKQVLIKSEQGQMLLDWEHFERFDWKHFKNRAWFATTIKVIN